MQSLDVPILVVEPAAEGALVHALRGAGAGGAVIAASGYDDGLNLLAGAAAAAQAVVLDVRDGLLAALEFIENVRGGATPADPATPIVAVASTMQVRAFRAALGDSIDGCLASPVSGPALRRALAAALAPGRLAALQPARRRAAAVARLSPSAPSSSGT